MLAMPYLLWMCSGDQVSMTGLQCLTMSIARLVVIFFFSFDAIAWQNK